MSSIGPNIFKQAFSTDELNKTESKGNEKGISLSPINGQQTRSQAISVYIRGASESKTPHMKDLLKNLKIPVKAGARVQELATSSKFASLKANVAEGLQTLKNGALAIKGSMQKNLSEPAEKDAVDTATAATQRLINSASTSSSKVIANLHELATLLKNPL